MGFCARSETLLACACPTAPPFAPGRSCTVPPEHTGTGTTEKGRHREGPTGMAVPCSDTALPRGGEQVQGTGS